MSDFGGMVSFQVGSAAEALALVTRTKLFFLAESLGGVESLIEVPGPMTHASVAGLAARGAAASWSACRSASSIPTT